MTSMMKKIIRFIKAIRWMPSRVQFQEEQLRIQQETIKSLREKVEMQDCEIRQLRSEGQNPIGFIKQHIQEFNALVDREFERQLYQDEHVMLLKNKLGTKPEIWGEKDKLHISPLAAVFTCLFNTNSGEITIGDYTFAGSNVSILAGSHDYYLNGLERRDAEIKSGCDINIGKGVWLGSGAVVLGPCVIEDNAVIAAGAVVVPGTRVSANCLYGGIPAKMIKHINMDETTCKKHIMSALSREGGVLFSKGWSEKRNCEISGTNIEGHWLVCSMAKVYVLGANVTVTFYKENNETVELKIRWGKNEKKICLKQEVTSYEFDLENEGLHEMYYMKNIDLDADARIFVNMAVVE